MQTLIVAVVLALALAEASEPRYKTETRLRRDLSVGYHDDVAPIDSGPVNVSFGVNLININDVDTRKGVADLNAWLMLYWPDKRLTWDPVLYSGVQQLRVDPKYIWLPDLMPFDSPHMTERMTREDSQVSVVLFNTGHVLYIPPVRLVARGVQDGNQFKISMKFGSWVFDGNKIDLSYYENKHNVTLNYYHPNADWDIVEAPITRQDNYYDCCTENYPSITMNITLSRKPSK